MKLRTVVSLALGEDWEGLCPRESLEHALTHDCSDRGGQAALWRQLLQDTPPADLERVMQWSAGINSTVPPEGLSWERWATWVESRLSEVAEDPSTLVPLPRHLRNWRWRSGELLPGAEGTVRDALARIVPPPGAGVREFLLVDLAEPVGTFSRADRATGAVEERPTQRLGVVLDRSAGLRVVGVTAADPLVDPRTEEWRARWPVLFTALGGWFGEASFERRAPWAQQARMLETEPDERLVVLAGEGADLLGLGDDDLRAAVAATGCVVEPDHLRWWLEWMFWRIGSFDWK